MEMIEREEKGTEEEVEVVRKLVGVYTREEQEWQREQLKLCDEGCGRYRLAPEGAGHYLQMTELELVVEEVR